MGAILMGGPPAVTREAAAAGLQKSVCEALGLQVGHQISKALQSGCPLDSSLQCRYKSCIVAILLFPATALPGG